MANDNLTIHDMISKIDLAIIALKGKLESLCKLMLAQGMKDEALVVDDMANQLNKMKLQLCYYDDVTRDRELQQRNKPLIIKKETQ